MAPKDCKNRMQIWLHFYEKGKKAGEDLKKSKNNMIEKDAEKIKGLTIIQIEKTVIKAFIEGLTEEWERQVP